MRSSFGWSGCCGVGVIQQVLDRPLAHRVVWQFHCGERRAQLRRDQPRDCRSRRSPHRRGSPGQVAWPHHMRPSPSSRCSRTARSVARAAAADRSRNDTPRQQCAIRHKPGLGRTARHRRPAPACSPSRRPNIAGSGPTSLIKPDRRWPFRSSSSVAVRPPCTSSGTTDGSERSAT